MTRNRFLVTLALVASAIVARADEPEPAAAQILAMADQAYGAFKDLTIESTMTIYEPGKTTGREVGFQSISKGEKRLVRFLSPGDIKGMGFLVENRDTLYALLPAFNNRVRRLGTHVKGQSFMGSDIGYEDMSSTAMTGIWLPKLVATEADAWVLEVTLLPGKDAEFPRMKIWVDKKIKQVNRIEYYDGKGAKAKTQTRSDFKLDQGSTAHYTPGEIKVVDHRRNDHSSVIRNTRSQADSGIADDMFTQRSLQRGQ